ncbi:MAG: RNA polymerase sigma factor [Kofleriaceae bacterium]|nr:RNA polymerase sigma factor [Kofleriaceae bacterium]MCB9574399.1 RNA polymerase sigma factor [Kofleriaceae bacterium]
MALTPAVAVDPAAGGVDDDLVARLRRGDRAALARTYEAHHVAVRAFARRLVGDDHAAEDLVHDTFVALPRAIQRYRGDGALRTFLIGVAVNHARRHTRSAARRRRAYDRVGDAAAARDDARDPRAEAIQRVLAARAWAALDRLPLAQRLAFVLCEVEQRTTVEAATIVGVPEGTIRSRLFHARRRLRAALGEAEDTP